MTKPPSFRINARMILELGAELISSDGVALYELIKNSVDARAERVKISVNVCLKHSKFLELQDKLNNAQAKLEADTKLDLEPPRAVSPRAEAELVRQLKTEIKEAFALDTQAWQLTAFSNLVLPARGLDQLRIALRRFYDRTNTIVVEDHGDGMSLQDLNDVYLTIGTRSRRKANTEAQSNGGPTFLGEKGVGRLSTMRLGDQLDVRTTLSGELRCNRLVIDWDRFSHDSDATVEEVRVKPRLGEMKADPTEKGTIVTIRHLRSDWTLEKFEQAIVNEFSRLIDPFEAEQGNRLLRLFYNGNPHYLPEIDQVLFSRAHALCTATFAYDVDGNASLRGFVNYRLREKDQSFVLKEPDLRGITKGRPFSAVKKLGPFEVQFWWFNRQLLTKANNVANASEIKALIRRWSGGLMLFKGQYRINPYGGPEDDWLSLDKKAFSSRGFKLNRQQVIGRVVISSANTGLVEQTNREGLTDTPEKEVFVDLLQHILFNEFKVFLDRCDRDVRVQEITTLNDLEEKIDATEDEISSRLRGVIARAPQERKALEEIERLVERLQEYIGQARSLAEEYETDRAKFVYLAGIGLMVEFILHELGRATAHTLDTLRSIQAQTPSSSLPASLPAAFDTLSDQLQTIVKRVDTLDPLSTSRRQQREDFDLFQVIRQIVESRAAQSARHRIRWAGNFNGPGNWLVNGVRGMFIQIIENLISNAIYWLGIQMDIEPALLPTITINLDPSEQLVLVTDNGTGVDPSQSERIFEAFVSHRPAQDGKGLGLYISREIATYHDWNLAMLPAAQVRPDRYNTFVLDLSAGRKPKAR